MAKEDAPAAFVGIHTIPYNAIVRPAQVWKVSKYFLRRWTPYLSASQVWLIIGARQFSYFNEKQPWFEAYDGALADAAGLHVKVFRRTIKKEIVAGIGHVAAFLARQNEGGYLRSDGVTRQTQSRYTIRLDDPLTPGDGATLIHWLRRNCPVSVTPESITELLDSAREIPAEALRATDPSPLNPEAPGLHSVSDIVRLVFPAVTGGPDLRRAADALHDHITSPELAHFDTQYFRRRWLPLLGPGPALLLTQLRSLCYFNEDTGELRDCIRLGTGELEALLQVSDRTLRRWFNKLTEFSQALEQRYPGPFYRFLETIKQSDQRVLSRYWVNLKTPLVPEDHSVYLQMSAHAAAEDSGAEDADRMFPTASEPAGQKVTHTNGAGGHKVRHTLERDGREVLHAASGAGQIVPYGEVGNGQIVTGWRSIWGDNKYYELLGRALRTTESKEQVPVEQEQYWHVSDRKASCSFAAVVAGGSLPNLLRRLDVQEPTRGAICRREPRVEDVVGWYLYVCREEGLQRPVSYAIRRLLAEDNPPEPFAQLAELSWAQWRLYAAAWSWRDRIHDADWEEIAGQDLFPAWCRLYGELPLDVLPFEVGSGLDSLPETNTSPTVPRNVPAATLERSVDDVVRGAWREAWWTLEKQLDPATFNAWLRDAEPLGFEGKVFVLGVQSEAAREWIAGRLSGTIGRTLAGILGEPISVRVVTLATQGQT